MTPAPSTHSWGHWPQQHHGYNMMDNSAFAPYDSRAVTSAPMVPSTMAPQYAGGPSYGITPMPAVKSHFSAHASYPYQQYEQPPTHMAMHYRMSPHEDRSSMPMMPSNHDWNVNRQYPHSPPQDARHRSPSSRSETLSAPKTPDPFKSKDITYNKPIKHEDIEFKTPIDIMMKAIQKKDQTDFIATGTEATQCSVADDSSVKSEPSSPLSDSEGGKETTGKVKKYVCPFDGCNKSFSQSTHLETHKRAHTGEKPYLCDWPLCNRSFSQPGNLKTHRRLHTGERPFQCDRCESRFAQRGNLKAHLNTHSNTKPFLCKLDSCNKCFTTRGNLKNHQNKYHKQTIQEMVDWIISLSDTESLSEAERDLLWYFSNIYKNSNKGIKGRGRDRRVSEMRMNKAKLAGDNLPQTTLLMSSFSRLGVMGY